MILVVGANGYLGGMIARLSKGLSEEMQNRQPNDFDLKQVSILIGGTG